MRYGDRRDAGRRLAADLASRHFDRPVVIALPRGGVPVAAEVAAELRAPLDILVVRKLGCPWRPELGMGAVAEGDAQVLNADLIADLRITPEQLDGVIAIENAEIRRRVRSYRGDQPAVPVAGRTVILVDDGLATGFTARAAIGVLRRRGAKQVVLAVPVAAADTVEQLRAEADDVICPQMPAFFMAVGQWYEDFRQVTDTEVSSLLAEHPARPTRIPPEG